MHTRSRLTSGQAIGRVVLASAIGLLVVQGCGEEQRLREGTRPGRAGTNFEAASASAPFAVAVVERGTLEQAPGGAEAKAVPTPKATAGRKIIYDTSVVLVTEDLNKLEAGLLQIIEVRGAYIADSDRTGATGATRQGHWKVRVPVDAYDAFVRGVLGLGELVSTKAQSQDVSAEYYDLDARTAAKRVEESRLLKHLADSTGRLDEILTVERELTRVRSEIEQMQGRLAVLSNLTALATVTVTASEIKNYIPAQAPTLGQKVARTFAGSLESVRNLGEAILLGVVALAPWLPLLIPAGLLFWLVARRANAYRVATTAGVSPRA